MAQQMVVGHAGNQGSFYNQGLSQRRARSVVEALAHLRHATAWLTS